MRVQRMLMAVALALGFGTWVQAEDQPAVIRPTENLVVEGIPPLSASLASETRRYTESRSASFVDWHPQRQEMLIATRFANTMQLHRVRTSGGARTQLTFEQEPITVATFEPGAGRYFLFQKDTGGNEFAQIYRYDLADGRITRLTDGRRAQNSGIEWNHRGDRIAYGSTRRNGKDRDVYIMDPTKPASDRLVFEAVGGGWTVMDWSPDDRRLLLGEYLSITESRLWLMDLENGKKTRLTPPTPESVAYAKARFHPDGTRLYLITDLHSEFHHLATLDLANGQVRALPGQTPWDVADFELSPDGKMIALVTNEAGVSRLSVRDTADGAPRIVSGLPDGVLSGLRWHRQGRKVGFTLTYARSPGDAYSFDVSSSTLTRWTESELGGLVADELSQPHLIQWKTYDGRELSGFLYEPPRRFAGRRPVIVSIHGGPEGQSQPRYLGVYNYFLNELGMALLLPNVRGSTGYGKTFTKLDNGLLREDSVKDIGSLLDWIAGQPRLDSGRIVVSGGSYGGFMSLSVAVRYSDRIACAVDVVGISNFNTFLKNTESYRRDLRRVEYGDERDPKMREFFERIAPANHARQITKPLLVVQGGNDPRVPASEAAQMVAQVRAVGTPVWYLLAKDEGHGFRKKSNADFQFYTTVEFIRRYGLGSGR